MRTIATFTTACIVAFWMGAIALIAVQNAGTVTLRFLNFESIAMPFGIVLAFSIILGILGMAIAQPLFGFSLGRSDD